MSPRRALPVLLAALLWPVFAGCEDEPEFPVLGEMPDFAFIDQDGEPFARDALEGRVVVASFLFTRCVTICPLLSQRTVELSERLSDEGDAVHFLSISVDPDNDTPELLRAHGERYGADFERWTLVTGPIAEVNDVVVRGFKLAMGEPVPVEGGPYEIMHSPRFVLVDQRGRIRGYYESNPDGLDALVTAVRALTP